MSYTLPPRNKKIGLAFLIAPISTFLLVSLIYAVVSFALDSADPNKVVMMIRVILGFIGVVAFIGIFVCLPPGLYFINMKELVPGSPWDERSGKGIQSVFPEELRGWNWGAAFLNWIWGAWNSVPLAFLSFVPLLSWVWWIVLGIKGSEWAWRNQKWESVEKFKESRRKWNIAGIVIFVVSIVLILIIPLLSTLAVVTLGSARVKARDAKRVSDIKQIQTGLEIYFMDNGKYPPVVQPKSSIKAGNVIYMSRVPYNPLPNGRNCPYDFDYRYEASGDGKSYKLNFCLEDTIAGLTSGMRTATPQGIE